jgi:hypothetical protein
MLIFYFLFQARKTILAASPLPDPESSAAATDADVAAKDAIKKPKTPAHPLGIMFESFTPQAFYYQYIIMGRRLLAAVITTFLITKTNVLFFCFIFLHGVFLVVLWLFNPYKRISNTRLEFVSMVLLILLSAVLQARAVAEMPNGLVIAFLWIFGALPAVALGCFIVYSIFSKTIQAWCPKLTKKTA